MYLLKKTLPLFILVIFTQSIYAKEKQQLLFYIGITMIKPVTELVRNFEKQNNYQIKILQGGSQDLYESIASSKKGDIYLPGSLSYRKKNIKEGLLLDGKFVGYNKLAIIVKKGNPKNISADLNELTKETNRVVLGNEYSGSVGNATKKLLKKFGNYEEAILNTISLASDSRNLTKSIIRDEADIIINWYATTFWETNKDHVEALIIDEKYAKKAKLVFNLLKTSDNIELSRKFLEYAASQEGRKVFYKYGFLDKNDLKNFDKVTF